MTRQTSPSLKEQFLLLNRRLISTNWGRWHLGLVIAICVAASLFRLAPIATSRFHQDEAIYGHWALQITTGHDPWLSHFPVDKPPLYIYTLALFLRLFGPTETGARLPSELASVVSLVLLYILGRRLYGPRTALVALALFAFSPFGILFAPTAMTDPLMVACVLGGLVTISFRHWGWAGLLLSLGFITKPQAILFLPLAVVLGVCTRQGPTAVHQAQHRQDGTAEAPDGHVPSITGSDIAWFVLGCGAAILPAIVWDVLRSPGTGFFAQGITSYGGLRWAPAITWPERLSQWCDILRYTTGSSWLNALLASGMPLLLLYGLIRWRTERDRLLDWVFVLFALAFPVTHTVLEFNVWDRYMLGLTPVIALILARILLLPGELIAAVWPKLRSNWRVYELGLAVLLVLALFRPAQDAANSRFPIGGAHGAYNGLDALVDYIRGHVPGNAVLYHRWLGWHYSFYLFDFPYLLQWYTSPDELATDAVARPGIPRYVAFPSWQSPTQTRWVLRRSGLDMNPLYETYRDNGTRSFTLYRIEEAVTDG